MGATVFYADAAELATLTNTFSVAGVATDPTTVSLTVTTPAGVATTYTYALGQITKTGTGVYTKDIPCSESGTWVYVWIGTGTASDVVAGTWTVQTTALQTLYCTVEELKSRLGITATTDDFELRLAVEAASRSIDDHCGRRFWRNAAGSPETRLYAADDWYRCCVDDLVSVSTLKTDSGGDGTFETTWQTSDYQLRPVNTVRATDTWPYTEIRAVGSQTFPLATGYGSRDERVQIAGVFGWPATPAAVKQAALVLAAEVFKLKDAPFGVAAMGEWGPVRVRQNPMAMTLLSPYVRYPVLVA